MEAQRVLDLFIPKDPPADQEKESSCAAARKEAAARESAVRSIDPSRVMTKKDLMEERRVKAQEDEIKSQHALVTGEHMMRVRDGMHRELDLPHETMSQCAGGVLLKDPTNQLAKLQHEKFQLNFESKMSELGKSASQPEHCKQSLFLDLVAESDSGNSGTKIFTPPKAISPKWLFLHSEFHKNQFRFLSQICHA